MPDAPRKTISAFLVAMERRLRVVLGDTTDDLTKPGKFVGVQPDGRPPNNCGQWYYAIHFAGLNSADPNALSNDKRLSATVTITRRMAYAPKDRRGSELFKGAELLDQADVVADTFHQDDTTRIAANVLISGTEEYEAANDTGDPATVNGYTTPLKLRSISEPQEVSPEWVGADPAQSEERDIFTCVVQFGDAQLIKPIGG